MQKRCSKTHDAKTPQNPSDVFCKDRMMRPETSTSPIRHGMTSEKLTSLVIDGKQIMLTNTNIACLAAVAHGIEYKYAITKAYGWKHSTILYSVRSLCAAHGLIEMKGAEREPSAYNPGATKTAYKLTENGETAVRILKETNHPFFAECEAWLRERGCENQGK
jgi:hypothetical protein